MYWYYKYSFSFKYFYSSYTLYSYSINTYNMRTYLKGLFSFQRLFIQNSNHREMNYFPSLYNISFIIIKDIHFNKELKRINQLKNKITELYSNSTNRKKGKRVLRKDGKVGKEGKGIRNTRNSFHLKNLF